MIFTKSKLYELRIINFSERNYPSIRFFYNKLHGKKISCKDKKRLILKSCEYNNLPLFQFLIIFFKKDPLDYINSFISSEFFDYARKNQNGDILYFDHVNFKDTQYTSYSIIQYVRGDYAFWWNPILDKAVKGNDSKLLKYACKQLEKGKQKIKNLEKCLWESVKNNNLIMFKFFLNKGAIELDRAYVLAEQYSDDILEYMHSRGWWI